jgi:hypothetical protein
VPLRAQEEAAEQEGEDLTAFRDPARLRARLRQYDLEDEPSELEAMQEMMEIATMLGDFRPPRLAAPAVTLDGSELRSSVAGRTNATEGAQDRAAGTLPTRPVRSLNSTRYSAPPWPRRRSAPQHCSMPVAEAPHYTPTQG